MPGCGSSHLRGDCVDGNRLNDGLHRTGLNHRSPRAPSGFLACTLTFSAHLALFYCLSECCRTPIYAYETHRPLFPSSSSLSDLPSRVCLRACADPSHSFRVLFVYPVTSLLQRPLPNDHHTITVSPLSYFSLALFLFAVFHTRSESAERARPLSRRTCLSSAPAARVLPRPAGSRCCACGLTAEREHLGLQTPPQPMQYIRTASARLVWKKRKQELY